MVGINFKEQDEGMDRFVNGGGGVLEKISLAQLTLSKKMDRLLKREERVSSKNGRNKICKEIEVKKSYS